jgi:thiol-disulfide isomerase/thioredoxin
VTIVEFSEFQCPFCRRVLPALRQVEERYRGRVRLVFRHFPLARHKEAPKAAEAAECARDQGRFWEMHDRLFANAEQLKPADLKGHARAIGIDGPAFDACLDSGRHAERWKRDLAVFAAEPNTTVKISALGTNDHHWTVDSIRRIVLDTIAVFGPSRCMFASNFPVDGLYSTLGTLFAAFDGITAGLGHGERADLFAGTARRFYRIVNRPF